MEKIKYYIEKYKIIIIFLLIIITLLIIIFIKNNSVNKSKIDNIEIIKNEENTVKEEKSQNVLIDIKGSIKKPGVYELKENSRVIDAIKSAGGLLANSNTEYII